LLAGIRHFSGTTSQGWAEVGLEQKLAASIEQVAQRKNAAQAQSQSAGAAPGWAQVLLVHTNALADVYAAALAHASTRTATPSSRKISARC
jgi:hypothetical protein